MSFELIVALQRVYGGDPAALEEQSARYQRALASFAARYGSGEVWVYRAPGRANLIGEHTDYNQGYVLPVALDKDVLICARPRPDRLVRLANREEEYGQRSFAIAETIARRPVGDWANYVQGPAQLLEREHGPGLRGFDAWVDGAAPHGVPRGAGLSSSSALTVASAVALADLNGIDLEGAELAESCSRAEWYVGTRGGIMDHFISVLARRGHALFLDCRPAADGSGYAYEQVPIPRGYAIILVDSGVRHRNTGPLFNRRVAEGRIGVRLLQRHRPEITHLRDVSRLAWPDLEPLLPEVIHTPALLEMGIDPDAVLDGGVTPETDTFTVRRRCRHVVTENDRVLRTVAALRTGDMVAFGQLLREAHASARDDYEISTPEIEVLVSLANAAPGTVGARLTGAGWGGCVVAVVREESSQAFRRALGPAYREQTGIAAREFICRSAAGAGLVLRTTA